MKIWLDTIDCDIIADAAKTGIISGVTTNPSILSQTKNVSLTLQKLLDLQEGPVAVQVTGTNVEAIIEEARSIFAFSSRMVVKIPINHQGLIAIHQLNKEGIPILGTGILFPMQAMLAAHHEVKFISPYFSHIQDNPLETLKTIHELVKKSNTQILVASLRQLDHILQCALLGVYGVTIKGPLYLQIIENQPLVESFSSKFFSEWTKTHGHISIQEALKTCPSIKG